MLFAVIERGHNIVHEFSRFQCIFMQWLRLFYKSSLGIVYSKKKFWGKFCAQKCTFGIRFLDKF